MNNQPEVHTPNADKETTKTFTPAQLKSFPGCEHYSDSEAAEIISTLEKLSAVCFTVVKNFKTHSIDNQYSISLSSNLVIQNKAA